jgi:hypothetical protein
MHNIDYVRFEQSYQHQAKIKIGQLKTLGSSLSLLSCLDIMRAAIKSYKVDNRLEDDSAKYIIQAAAFARECTLSELKVLRSKLVLSQEDLNNVKEVFLDYFKQVYEAHSAPKQRLR